MDTIKTDTVQKWDSAYSNLQTTFVLGRYDIREYFILNMLYQYVLEDVKQYISPDVNGLRVVEVGCGGARISCFLATQGAKCIGTDTSDEALRLGKANYRAANVQGEFLVDDLLDSKLPADSFDVVMSFGLLEHFSDLTPPIASLTKLVRPGGIQIHTIIPHRFWANAFCRSWNFCANLLYNVLKGRFNGIVTNSSRNFPHFENDFSLGEYRASFEKNGSEVLRMEGHTLLTQGLRMPAIIERALYGNVMSPLRGVIKKVDRSGSGLVRQMAPIWYVVARKKI